MQNENIMSVNNAPQAFRGPVREPMAQINFGLEEDIYGNQVDHFLRKNTDMPSMAKPHNAFIDQLETGLPMGGLADDKQKAFFYYSSSDKQKVGFGVCTEDKQERPKEK